MMMSRSNDVSSGSRPNIFLVFFRILCSILHLLRKVRGKPIPVLRLAHSGGADRKLKSAQFAGTTPRSTTGVAYTFVMLLALLRTLSLALLLRRVLIQSCILQWPMLGPILRQPFLRLVRLRLLR